MCGPISIPFASKMLFNTVKPAARGPQRGGPVPDQRPISLNTSLAPRKLSIAAGTPQ